MEKQLYASPPEMSPPGAPPAYPGPGAAPPPQYEAPPPMAPGYPPPATNVVIVQQPQFGSGPTATVCPHCKQTVTTQVHYTSGGRTWIVAGIMCLFGCWLGCFLIPFFTNTFKDANHSCSICKKFIAKEDPGLHRRYYA